MHTQKLFSHVLVFIFPFYAFSEHKTSLSFYFSTEKVIKRLGIFYFLSLEGKERTDLSMRCLLFYQPKVICEKN